MVCMRNLQRLPVVNTVRSHLLSDACAENVPISEMRLIFNDIPPIGSVFHFNFSTP